MQQVGLHLTLGRDGPSCVLVLLDLELELGDADGDLLERPDGPQVERLHVIAHALQLDVLAVLDVPDDATPRLKALQRVGRLEHRLHLAADAVAQEAPDGAVDVVEAVQVHVGAMSGTGEHVLGDFLAFPLFCPREHLHQRWAFADEVPFQLALPGRSALRAVELEAGLTGQLVVEQLRVGVVELAEGPELER